MRADGASTRPAPARSPLTRRAATFPAMLPALAAGLIALGAISPARGQEEAPLGPSATIGALGAASKASAREASTPAAPPADEEEIPLRAAAAAAARADPAAAAAGGAAATPIDAPAPGEQSIAPDEAPLGTTVIPTASQQQALQPPAGSQGSQVINYEANQQMPLNEPQLHSLQEFMNEGVNTSPLGVELQEGARRTKSGREVDGLLVVALQPGSPAERAGVQAGHRQAPHVLEGAAVGASLVV